MPLGSWLFIRGSESIWVERPHGRVMLDAFQVALAERLTSAGWFLWGVNRERRVSGERRSVARSSPDRRRSATS
jgi:hypothetical protein